MSNPKIRQSFSKKMTMLIWCSLVVGICFLAFYVQQKNRAQLAASELAQLQRNAQRITTLRYHQPPSLPTGTSLQALFKTTAEKHGVLLGALHPEQQTLDVVLPPQPVKPLLLWLESLQQEYGMGVDSIDLSLRGDSNIVTVNKLSFHVPSTR